MKKWRHHKGFSYKQPKGVPQKFDEKTVSVYRGLRSYQGKLWQG
ncbi:hypothetical protein HKB10_03565 [Vibrio parahaemolyticus]|nr:hypothetical protein [Vibrio parahaemolyticus]EHH1173269.1 hypothetical protein [Vibrio parahaemolyticus]NMU47432.1 hypothetical protein [Vibrio parahaemolyticus]HBC3433638.1 hypothetical protein [Vibrio parahaemolyticus]HBH7864230.1 hypothetical protein [Vibrio parahaemolyticus]